MEVNVPNILSILEEVLVKDDEEYKESHSHTIRHNPSSAMVVGESGKRIGACMRQLWYKAKQVPQSEPRKLSSRLTALFGDAIHTGVIAKLQKSTKLRIIGEAPGKVTIDGLTKEISFRLDGLVTYRGELGGLELKTGMGFGIQKMVREQGPKQKDILQVLSYFGTNDAISWFSLVYLARDSGFVAEYHIWKEDGIFYIKGLVPHMAKTEITDMSFPGIVNEWKKLEEHIEKDAIPKRDYKVVFADDGRIVDSRVKKGLKYASDKACMWCSYQTTCWKSDGWEEDSIKIVGGKPVHLSKMEEKKL